VAAILSIVETCCRIKIPIRSYLAAAAVRTPPPALGSVLTPSAPCYQLHSLPYFTIKSTPGTDGFL